MTFDDLLTGDAVFVDANVLAYYLQPHAKYGPPCAALMHRIDNRELLGYYTTQVCAEVTHRLMTFEVSAAFGWPFAGIGNKLRTNPAEVKKLTGFRSSVERLLRSPLQLLPVTAANLVAALALCQSHGLLTNDGVLVAVMQANGLTKVASNDTDPDRVPDIARYAPV